MILYILIPWNLACLIITAYDKRAARKHRRRVPEKTFLWFAALLGGAGVLIGFYLCRHKTRHMALLAKTWLLTLLSAAVSVFIYVSC